MEQTESEENTEMEDVEEIEEIEEIEKTMPVDEIVQYVMQNIIDPESENSEKEAIKFILQNLSTKNFLVELKIRQKCQQHAREKISAGNKLYDAYPFMIDDILKLYSEAIAYAPSDSPELCEAYSYRSAILSNARLFKDSSKDIDRVLQADYSEDLKARLYIRQIRNLLTLDIRNRPEIEEVATAAHRWMEETDDDYNKNLLEDRLQELSERKIFPKPYEKPDNSHIVPHILNPHEIYSDASNAIELKYSKQFGRHFVAARDIKPSEILVRQRAYAIAPSNQFLYTYCWNCSKRAWAGVPCEHCVNVIYCDERCRDEAWNNYHELECPFLTFMSLNRLADTELMGMKLTIKALKGAESIEVLKDNLKTVDAVSDPLLKGFIEGKMDGTKYENVYTLTRSFPFKCKTRYYVENLIRCTKMLFALIKSTKILGEEIKTMSDLADNESALFIGELLIRNMDIAEMNCYDIANLSNKRDFYNRGIQLSCLTSFFNHSCDPNACMVHAGDIMGIRSLQIIKKGEQIFVNYMNRYEECPTSYRQKIHEDRYNFLCECHACQEYWGPHSQWPSFMEQPLPNQIKYKIRKKFAKFCKHFQGQSPTMVPELMLTDPSYIPLLLELLVTLCENAYYPCYEICEYKGLLNEYFEHFTY
ncbi:SET and MYND domain-containing protein 4-like [Chelonus insularis]|uniref:SET and MYND domain-containing protein 4-like n=1 Tax=Chelonus insularis TaxID=460826 RepID=UPI00158B5963|nr:SET and MYND domain-containing protein 4-like [Chelonus insularis]XP_034945534.1 SET and MYND domain-containing protein 4-like [Chelonus insularis]